MYLARAALSPLAFGVDAEGNVWWASNPRWLREVAGQAGITFTRLMMMAEGTCAVVSAGRPGRGARVRSARFTAVARPQDERFGLRSWHYFTASDRERAQAPGMVTHVTASRGPAALPAVSRAASA